MSNVDYESLGKSNEKKWSQIWKLLIKKGFKIVAQKKISFRAYFISLSRIVLVLVFLTLFNALFATTSQSLMSKFSVDFWNPWGKGMEKNDLRLEK